MATYLDFEQKIKNLQDDIESAIIRGDSDSLPLRIERIEGQRRLP